MKPIQTHLILRLLRKKIYKLILIGKNNFQWIHMLNLTWIPLHEGQGHMISYRGKKVQSIGKANVQEIYPSNLRM